ncbi:MAG TPA: nuclear transport factor 2 family protein [Pyrinomonadaceae bacterium]|jgi:ketosteroid isomerase-like protein
MKRKQRITVACVALSILCALAGCIAQPDSARDNEQAAAAVRAVIEAQQAAWNRGDVEGYMDGYERAETTTFVSGDTITRGWQTVLERYKRAYDTRAKMGTLAFSDLDIKPLSPFYALANGRWQLTRERDAPHGRFTLLFRRASAGWRIVQDTTTAAP